MFLLFIFTVGCLPKSKFGIKNMTSGIQSPPPTEESPDFESSSQGSSENSSTNTSSQVNVKNPQPSNSSSSSSTSSQSTIINPQSSNSSSSTPLAHEEKASCKITANPETVSWGNPTTLSWQSENTTTACLKVHVDNIALSNSPGAHAFSRRSKRLVGTNQSLAQIRTQIIWSKESSMIIDNLYRRILNRVPESAAAVQGWQQAEQNGSSLPNVIYAISYSNEVATKIIGFYRARLNRDATGPEVNYYRGLLYAGWSLIQIKSSIDSLK